jgi:hypothetical protein
LWWFPAKIASGVMVGWHLVALTALALGLLNLESFLPAFFLALTVLVVWKNRPYSIPKLVFSRADLGLLILCFLSVFLLYRLVFPFGQPTAQGLSIGVAHYIDSTWHLSLINQLTSSIPPNNPIFAGVKLSNYHYLVDLQLALAHRLTGIPIPTLFFQLSPLVFYSSLAVLLVALCIALSKQALAGALALLFFLTGSNLYYLVPYFFPSSALRPSVAWVDTYSTLGVNFPFTVSLSLLCISWLLLVSHTSSISKVALLSGSLLIVKSHTALVWLASLVLAKKFRQALLSGCLLLAFTFLVVGASSSSPLMWSPFWFIATMFSSSDHFNFPAWELARQYLLTYPGYPGLARLYLSGLAWFIGTNFGPLILGLFASSRHPLLLYIFLVGFGLTMTFIYPSTAIVTVQFIYLSVFACAIGLAILLVRLPRMAASAIGMVIWTLLLPGVVHTQKQYASASTHQNISPNQLALALYSSRLPSGTFLLDPAFRNGSWFTAYSAHPAYLGDYQSLPPLGLDTASRTVLSTQVLSCEVSPQGQDIHYIVAPLDSCLESSSTLTPLFTNSAGTIFRVL